MLASAYGTAAVIYSSADSAFAPVGTWAPLDTTNTIPAESLVNQFRMRAGTAVVTVLNADKTSGNIYSITGSVITKLAYTDATTSAFMDFGDDLSSFVRVGTTSVFWYHQRSSG